MGPLLFLVYINDLADSLSSNAKLFADDTSLFLVIHDAETSGNELKSDLSHINKRAFQWKMSFNPDPSKMAQEIIFSRKTKFLILRYVLIKSLSRKPHIKNTLAYFLMLN